VAKRDRRPAKRIINSYKHLTAALLCVREQRLCTGQQCRSGLVVGLLPLSKQRLPWRRVAVWVATSLQVSAKTPISAACGFPGHKYNNGGAQNRNRSRRAQNKELYHAGEVRGVKYVSLRNCSRGLWGATTLKASPGTPTGVRKG
jgi:hypothetical protein